LEGIEITVEEGTASEKNVASALSTISETTKNELPIQLVTFSCILFDTFSV